MQGSLNSLRQWKKKYRADAQIWRKKNPVASCNQVTLFLLAKQTFSADSGLEPAREEHLSPAGGGTGRPEVLSAQQSGRVLRSLSASGFGIRCPLSWCSCIHAHRADKACALPLIINTHSKERMYSSQWRDFSPQAEGEESRVKLL